MAAAGARTQRPVGSVAWISTERENVSQLLDQEMEEVEYPVSHEMDWLNEHMAEIFNNNQFNFTEVFKTPGKMRGKTPRTARKRNVDESRAPLSEIFSTAHNQSENKSNASPKRSPAKPAAPTTTTATANAKATAENVSQPPYADLSQNLNSFPQYNTDSGYHGMPDDDEGEDDDDVVLTQIQTESQTSTQPLENELTPKGSPAHGLFKDRRTTESSSHSAHEDVRQRGDTAEPMNIDSTANHKVEMHPPKPQEEKEPETSPLPAEPEQASGKESEKKPEQKFEQEPKPQPVQEPEPQTEQKLESEQDEEPEPEQEPEPESEPEPVHNTKSSPVKTPATQPSQPQEEEEGEQDKEDMALDNLDDIGSPSDGSTPERPPIRKSSLTFASLPAREPLTKKSLGGTRMSRTSHVDIAKLNNTGSSGYLGRQTGGHRTTQAALDEGATQGEKMDIDDDTREGTDADTRASKLHNKSSTQRLHEKISMLGKLQPSRPTKSIPSVSGLPSAQVSYPELPPVSKTETKPEASNRGSQETPAPEPMATDEEDWIMPLNTPQRPNMAKSQTTEKTNPAFEKDVAPMARKQDTGDDRMARPNDNSTKKGRKSTTPLHSPPQRPSHQKNASAPNLAADVSTTPVGSPDTQDAPLSASKWRLQSIMQSAKGLFSNAGSISAAARVEASSPDEPREQPGDRAKAHATEDRETSQPIQSSPPAPKQEGRRTRSSTEREEKRRQREIEDRQREEQEEQEEKAREQEKQKAIQLKAAQEKVSLEREERATSVAAPTPKIPQPQKHTSKEPEPTENTSKSAIPPPASQQQKQPERRPVKPTRELQKPRPQPVSIRVGSALSRQIPIASNNSVQESSAPAPTPASASKPSTLKKKASNNSLHTASSNSSFKSSVSSNSQRKAQLASERKKEQEELQARRKEEQRREIERKRAAQQQEEARRQELRRAEAERRERERHASEDPKKAAHMQAIEKRRLENARRLERQGSQQPGNDTSSLHQQERPASQASRPASRLGSIQPYGRSINQPQPNPAKPPKRALDDEPSHRPGPSKPSIQPSGDSKRRRTEDEHNPPPSVRPTMAPPIRQSNIRKEPTKPSIFSSGQASAAHQSGSSIYKTAQPQRPAHPMDMSKYASGKIPFAEPSNASQPSTSKAPSASSSQKPAVKASPKYPSGENIQLPEIATDSEDEDSDSEMLPVPKWAQPKELEGLLRQQEGMEVDSIFGPIAPFSLEETFKADKKIKKFRDRTSSANWSGADRLTQDEIRKDLAERQRLKMNGGWTFDS